jgi:hypothetical protein
VLDWRPVLDRRRLAYREPGRKASSAPELRLRRFGADNWPTNFAGQPIVRYRPARAAGRQEVTLERVSLREAFLKLAASHRVGRIAGGPPSEAWAGALVAELAAHFA